MYYNVVEGRIYIHGQPALTSTDTVENASTLTHMGSIPDIVILLSTLPLIRTVNFDEQLYKHGCLPPLMFRMRTLLHPKCPFGGKFSYQCPPWRYICLSFFAQGKSGFRYFFFIYWMNETNNENKQTPGKDLL